MTNSHPPRAAELRGILASFVKEHRLAGASGGVVLEGELAWGEGCGLSELRSQSVLD